jgi:hypothetical protein
MKTAKTLLDIENFFQQLLHEGKNFLKTIHAHAYCCMKVAGIK